MVEALANFHFLRPWWLVAIPVVIALAALAHRTPSATNRWRDAVAPELLKVLLDAGTGNPLRRLLPLATLGFLLAIGALAGPTFERLPLPVEQKNDALVIVLDLSLSMYAVDVKPSRIGRARHEIADILRAREEGFTGLVAYAGDAHTVAPLTDDVRTIENLLAALEPDMMPVLGSRPDQALEAARQLFENAGLTQGRLLLVTDGIDRIDDVTRHRHARFPISILGIGTENGGPIPLDFVDQPGRFLTNDQGVVIRTRLDEDRLANVARICHGRYHRLTIDDRDSIHLLETPLPEPDDTVEIEREFDSWHDVGYWLVLPALLLAGLGFRRGVLAAFALLMFTPPVHADLWDDLWQRRDQRAYTELADGRPDMAASLFNDERWRAVAQYRIDDFQNAALGFAADPSALGQYNLGNALAKLGALPDAIAAYDRVLSAEPQHADAAFNKALVERLLEQQPQQSGNENQQGSPNSDNDDDARFEREPGQDPSDEQSPEQGEDLDEQQQAQDSPARAEGDQSEDAQTDAMNRDELEQAAEQWLRRVPDDPGGLLRRKFQYETNQRLRRGDYRNRETERIW